MDSLRPLTVLGASFFAATAWGATLEPVVITGPSTNRIDMLFIGDGYLEQDLDTLYVQHIHSMLDHMFHSGEEPFGRYQNFFNVHRVNIASNERGADVPPLGIFRDTALDAKYYSDGDTERSLNINPIKALQEVGAAAAPVGLVPEMLVATVNDTRYGGTGGVFAVYAGGNSSATEVALHELGHSFADLADEYSYDGPINYVGLEPSEPNVTKNPTGAKWSQWLGYEDPILGTIGAYEGGKYSEQGIYRPSLNSKMRSLYRPFDAVSREQFILNFYEIVDPLDEWLANTSLLLNPAELWVDPIDEEVINVEWFVNGELIAGAMGSSFDPLTLGLGPGLYEITARAFDPTGFDPVNGWVRTHTDLLEQFVTWQVEVSVPEWGSATMSLLAFAGLLSQRSLRRLLGNSAA